jgi:hypothetical protein
MPIRNEKESRILSENRNVVVSCAGKQNRCMTIIKTRFRNQKRTGKRTRRWEGQSEGERKELRGGR